MDYLAKQNLIEKLNELYAGEWLATYQYWLGAKLAQNASSHTIKELEKHANEELEHARLLAEKIIELGGTPVISPDRLTSVSCCPYAAPTNPCVMEILRQNLEAEKDAVNKYNAALKFADTQETYNLLVKIRKDEEEHIADINKMKSKEKGE